MARAPLVFPWQPADFLRNLNPFKGLREFPRPDFRWQIDGSACAWSEQFAVGNLQLAFPPGTFFARARE
jgi:hypothetical protein